MTRPVEEWARDPICQVTLAELQERLAKAWLPERALLMPAGRRKHSRFRGVTWAPQLGKWKAQIRDGGKVVHLGWFDSEEDAARTWNSRARELYGTDARLNRV